MITRESVLLSLFLSASVVPSASAQPSAGFEPLDLRRVEQIQVDGVHPAVGGERVVDVYFRALTSHGQPVENLRLVDVEVREDDRRVSPDDILDLTTLEQAEVGVACVIALDTSRTMIGQPFLRAKSAAIHFLDRLGSRDVVAVVAFSSAVEVVASFTDARADVRARLSAMTIDREAMSTVLYDGVYQAGEVVRRGTNLPRRSFVIVFSDGRDGGSGHALEAVIRLAQGEENDARIPIFTVGYAGRGGGGLEVLRQLAQQTGAISSSSGDLEEFYDTILRQMRVSYLLRYESDMDGNRHVVEVAAEGKRDARSAVYPKLARRLWGWAFVAGMAVVVLLLIREYVGSRSLGTLRIVHGPLADARFPLRRGRTRIGSLADNDLVIDSVAVSRYHAEICATRKTIRIEDLRSTNGTLVNGASVESSPIQPGDRIRLGDVDMVFER